MSNQGKSQPKNIVLAFRELNVLCTCRAKALGPLNTPKLGSRVHASLALQSQGSARCFHSFTCVHQCPWQEEWVQTAPLSISVIWPQLLPHAIQGAAPSQMITSQPNRWPLHTLYTCHLQVTFPPLFGPRCVEVHSTADGPWSDDCGCCTFVSSVSCMNLSGRVRRRGEMHKGRQNTEVEWRPGQKGSWKMKLEEELVVQHHWEERVGGQSEGSKKSGQQGGCLLPF